MKINWGTGICIAMLCFILFIVYFLVKASTDKTYDHQLVTENYYGQELEFQEYIQKQRNAERDGVAPRIDKVGEGLSLTFPEKLNFKKIDGIVKFYRPSEQKLDFQLPLTLSEGKMIVPNALLKKGRWNIEVSYIVDNQEYSTSFKIE